MFREFLLITDDYTFRVNDGWIILSYWKYISKNVPVQHCMLIYFFKYYFKKIDV